MLLSSQRHLTFSFIWRKLQDNSAPGNSPSTGWGGGGLLSHIIGGGAAFFLVSLTAVFVSSRITKRLKTLTLWPMPPPRPPHGWDFQGRSRLLVIGKIQWLFFDLYPKSFTGACGPLHPYVWGSGRKVG